MNRRETIEELTGPTSVWNAAGTWDVSANAYCPFDVYVQKTLTLHQKDGNPEPHKAKLPDGSWVNWVGLKNVGIYHWVAYHLRTLRAQLADKPLVVSVLGYDLDEWRELVAILDDRPEVAAIELNLSCPNTQRDESPEHRIVRACREQTDKPLVGKLRQVRPDVAWISGLGKDLDAIAVTNTRPLDLPLVGGGLSGPLITGEAVMVVMQLRRIVFPEMPIIGMGGVDGIETAERFLGAGASSVAVGSASFNDPQTAESLQAHLLHRYADRA